MCSADQSWSIPCMRGNCKGWVQPTWRGEAREGCNCWLPPLKGCQVAEKGSQAVLRDGQGNGKRQQPPAAAREIVYEWVINYSQGCWACSGEGQKLALWLQNLQTTVHCDATTSLLSRDRIHCHQWATVHLTPSMLKTGILSSFLLCRDYF